MCTIITYWGSFTRPTAKVIAFHRDESRQNVLKQWRPERKSRADYFPRSCRTSVLCAFPRMRCRTTMWSRKIISGACEEVVTYQPSGKSVPKRRAIARLFLGHCSVVARISNSSQYTRPHARSEERRVGKGRGSLCAECR